MCKWILMIVYFIAFPTFHIFAQSDDVVINPDRPDQTDGSHTVNKNYFIGESGIQFADLSVITNLMFRYGITKSTELRLEVNAGKDHMDKGLMPIGIGVKQHLSNEYGILPSIGIIGDCSFEQWASKDYRSSQTLLSAALAFENTISKKITIGYNIGIVDNLRNFIFTLEGVYSPTEKISTFLEFYSSFNQNYYEQNIDIGVTYLINNKLQADFAVGKGLFRSYDKVQYATVGISWMIDFNNK